MPYRVEWLAEPRIVFVNVTHRLTLPEVAKANGLMLGFLNQAGAPLYVVVDVSELTDYPRIASELQPILRSFYHPMLGGSYIYGVTTPAINVILRILERVSPFNYKITKSFNEALTAIEAREPALGPLIAAIDRNVWV